MVRPRKEGLEYFPLDVDIEKDDKMYMIQAELGNAGFGLFIKLLIKIYRNGYFISWSEREVKIFALQNSTDIYTVNKLVDICLEEGIFNTKLYKKYKILTSGGIQRRYLIATERRVNVKVITQYLCTDISNMENIVNVNINSINVNINSINDDIM